MTKGRSVGAVLSLQIVLPRGCGCFLGGAAVYQDKTCMLFSGTVITVGRARAVVAATGGRTAIGRIHSAIVEVSEEMTPLKRKLDEFGQFLAKVRNTRGAPTCSTSKGFASFERFEDLGRIARFAGAFGCVPTRRARLGTYSLARLPAANTASPT
eukprot:1195973-Prorocentrum_minimum.AAC.5